MSRSSHVRDGNRPAGQLTTAKSRAPARRRSAAGNLPVPHIADAGRLRRFTPDEVRPLAMTYAIKKWAVLETSEEDLAEVEAFIPLGHPCHYRVHPAKSQAIGHFEFCGLADGFLVHINDIVHTVPHALSVSAPDMLRIRIGSHDNCEYVSAHGASIDLKGPGAVIIVEPAGQPPAAAAFDGRNRATNICIHRSMLKRLYTQREHELPTMIRAFVAGTLERTVVQGLPLTPALLRCLEDLQGCDLEGHGRRLFIRSKAVEVLCHAFRTLGQDEDGALLETSALKKRGVLKAKQMLTDNFVTPPSLDDLAHDVGLSRSTLCSGFRQIVGQSVFDYIADLRMQRALTLLNQRDASITQIAYEVGYSHPSSFSLAVQRRFGATPSELRSRRLPAV